MKQALGTLSVQIADEQDQRIFETVAREQARMRNFIRRRVPDRHDAEDKFREWARFRCGPVRPEALPRHKRTATKSRCEAIRPVIPVRRANSLITHHRLAV